MTKKLRKSLKLYFSKLKRIPSLSPSSPHSLLSSCKYPKTPSFSASDRRNIPANPNPNPSNEATLSDVDRFLQENFHSLYLHDNNDTTDDDDHDHCVDSDVEANVDASSSSKNTELQAVPAAGDGVAVTTFSKDPYGDFRDSMEEMVEARHRGEVSSAFVTLDWDFMEEMLFCYLELNDRSVHKYILKAFTDLAVGFRKRKVVDTTTTMMTTTKAKMSRGRRRRRRGGDGGEWLTEMRAQRESMHEGEV